MQALAILSQAHQRKTALNASIQIQQHILLRWSVICRMIALALLKNGSHEDGVAGRRPSLLGSEEGHEELDWGSASLQVPWNIVSQSVAWHNRQQTPAQFKNFHLYSCDLAIFNFQRQGLGTCFFSISSFKTVL